MITSQVVRQASELVSYERYLDALALIDRSVNGQAAPIIPTDPPLPEHTYDGLETYLRRHQGEPYATALAASYELITLCAAGAQLCMLTLGMGARAVDFIRRATQEAERHVEPFNEMLMSTEEYFSMMWYYNAMPDQDVALRNAYRINSRYPSYAYEARCRDILEAKDWDEKRCRYINFYTIFPDEKTDLVVEHTLLNNPVSTESYEAAMRDSVLMSLERGRHTKQNDWYWMQTLIRLVSDVHDLIKLLPVDLLDGPARSALYDAMLSPLAGHIAYQQADGFKTDYANPAKAALKEYDDPQLASLPAIERIRAAQAGERQPGSTPQIQDLPEVSDDGYFTSTAFENDRVFLSSSFRDMIAERDYLLTYTFPEVDRHLREFGVRLTPVDLRGIKLDGSEEGYDKECFKYCLGEIDRSDSLIGLIGSRYGWIMYDVTSTDPAMAALVTKVAKEHGVPVNDMSGKSITHIEMMYGLRALERRRCYFYVRDLHYTNGASEADLRRIGYADGHAREADARQAMVMGAYGIERIAPENEPGSNVQYYSASFDGRRISDVEGLGESISTKLIHDHVFKRSAKRREDWYTRLLSYWSDMAHLSIPHPRLEELLGMQDRFIMLTGEEGIGKTTLLAQYWETLRQRGALVVPVEALLDPDCSSVEAMVDFAARIEARLRVDLPKGNRLTKEVYIILDGLERVIGRHNRTTLLDTFREQYSEGVHLIVCSHEQNLAVPGYFRVMRLAEPPAPAAELVRNAAYKVGKRLDQQTTERLAELAKASGGNPLYTDLVTKRLLYLLQDEYEEDPAGWFERAVSRLDGSVSSAGELMADRTVMAVGERDRELAHAVIEQVVESRQGSLSLSGLVSILRAKGLLPEGTQKLFGGPDAQTNEQGRRLIRIVSLMGPLVLYDYSRQTVSMAHQSFIGTGKYADAQAEAIGSGQAGEDSPAEKAQQITLSYLMGAIVAAAFAGSLFIFPFNVGSWVPTVVQVLALALLYGPIGLRRDDWKNEQPTAASLLVPPLYYLGAIFSALAPLLVILRDDLPQAVQGFASVVGGGYPYLVGMIITVFCMSRVAASPRGGLPVVLSGLAAVVGFIGSAMGFYLVVVGRTIGFPVMAACYGLIALLYLLVMVVDRT